MYFTGEHEKAIIQYASTNNIEVRERLYREFIGPAFNEMVDKIVFTYKFTSLPNIDELKDECKVWLTTILDKFDKDKGYKAFSYFSVITKNWFIQKVKKTSKRNQREILHEDVSKESDLQNMTVENPYDDIREQKEFWELLWKEIEGWRQLDLKTNERKVLEAAIYLLENPDVIDIYNKKAIYNYLRWQTDLNTKQVVNNLNKMRSKYKVFKTRWNEGET